MFRKFFLTGTALTMASCSAFTPAPGPAGPPGPPGTPPVVSTTPPVISVASIANDISLIANGIASAANNPAIAVLIPANTRADFTQAVAALQSIAAKVAADPNAQATKATVAQVEGLVNDILADVAGVPLPQPWPTVLTAAQVLLPVVESAVGILVPMGEMQAKMSTPMTAKQARDHLAAGH